MQIFPPSHMHRFNPLWMAASFVAPLQVMLLVLSFIGTAGGFPTGTQNITIQVPQGTTNHGDPSLLCTPPTGIDLTKFYLLNYFAHALTVVSYPGESRYDVIISLIAAVLFPTSGAMRGIGSILRHSVFKSTDLQKAARSGALYMVVRSPRWKLHKVRVEDDPGAGAVIEEENVRENFVGREDIITEEVEKDIVFKKGIQAAREEDARWDGVVRDIWVNDTRLELGGDSGIALPTTGEDLVEKQTNPQAVISIYEPSWMGERTMYWSYPDTRGDVTNRDLFGPNKQLPDEYDFAFVPRNAAVEELGSIPIKLPYSYSWIKGAAAILQALYAIFTLYDSRGSQIEQYGYAAFGLTVVPYAVMSVLNLFANIVTPSYSTLYLVENEVMKEAERRKGLRFSNVVGRIKLFEDPPETDNIIRGGQRHVVGHLTDGDVLCLPSVTTSQNEDLTTGSTSNAGRHLSVKVPPCQRFYRTDRVRALISPPHEQRVTVVNLKPSYLDPLFFCAVCGIEIAIIGGLSGFHQGTSTRAQRVWTMTWFAFGCLSGFIIHRLKAPLEKGVAFILSNLDSNSDNEIQFQKRRKENSQWVNRSLMIFLILTYCAPSIGGFIVVGQMVNTYGSCLTHN